MKTLNKSLTKIPLVETDGQHSHYQVTNTFFPKMVKRNPTEYSFRDNGKWTTLTYTKEHKLDTSYYNVHVAFRKACDSSSSSIIWNCMGVLADNHRELLMDTMDNSLPKILDKESPIECQGFSTDFKHMWEMFFRRLSGYILVKDERKENYPFDGEVCQSVKKYSELYQVIMANLECAVKIESESEGAYAGFPYFMYFGKDEE